MLDLGKVWGTASTIMSIARLYMYILIRQDTFSYEDSMTKYIPIQGNLQMYKQ